jgi:hypothetical protein
MPSGSKASGNLDITKLQAVSDVKVAHDFVDELVSGDV